MQVSIKGMLKSFPEHFTDPSQVTTLQDKLAGETMAGEIGDTFIDCRQDPPYKQWQKIAKALRLHGFDFSFKKDEEVA